MTATDRDGRDTGRARARRAAPRTATTRDVTEINRTAVVDLLRRDGPLSRAEIRTRSGLGSATVERLVGGLIDAGLVEPAGTDHRRAPGRPATLLRYVPDRTSVLAVDLTDLAVRSRRVDTAGNVLHEEMDRFAFGAGSPGDVRLAALMDHLDRAIRDDRTIAAIGIAVPAAVHEGSIAVSTELAWRNVALGAMCVARTGLPVVVENDANATALGEWTARNTHGASSLVSIVLGAGFGAGVVSDGSLLRGAASAAGEIGYLLASRNAFDRYFTAEGDMESRLASYVRPFAEGGAERPDHRIGPAFRILMSRAANGDAAAAEARELFLDDLAFACAAVSVVLAPDVIVLAGALGQYVDEVAQALRDRLAGRIPAPPAFEASTLGFDAAITGVGLLALERSRNATYLM